MAAGDAKLAGKYPPDPLENPGIVAVARSAPVGTAGLPVVARRATVRFGVVPVHPLQNRSRSTPVNEPERPATNVCPAQLVLVNPNPLFVTEWFCWSTTAALLSRTSPGLVVRSRFVPEPVRKSDCDVSTKLPFVGARVNAKSLVVV